MKKIVQESLNEDFSKGLHTEEEIEEARILANSMVEYQAKIAKIGKRPTLSTSSLWEKYLEELEDSLGIEIDYENDEANKFFFNIFKEALKSHDY